MGYNVKNQLFPVFLSCLSGAGWQIIYYRSAFFSLIGATGGQRRPICGAGPAGRNRPAPGTTPLSETDLVQGPPSSSPLNRPKSIQDGGISRQYARCTYLVCTVSSERRTYEVCTAKLYSMAVSVYIPFENWPIGPFRRGVCTRNQHSKGILLYIWGMCSPLLWYVRPPFIVR